MNDINAKATPGSDDHYPDDTESVTTDVLHTSKSVNQNDYVMPKDGFLIIFLRHIGLLAVGCLFSYTILDDIIGSFMLLKAPVM